MGPAVLEVIVHLHHVVPAGGTLVRHCHLLEQPDLIDGRFSVVPRRLDYLESNVALTPVHTQCRRITAKRLQLSAQAVVMRCGSPAIPTQPDGGEVAPTQLPDHTVPAAVDVSYLHWMVASW